MDVFYFKDPKFNFGDDLNAYIWKEVLPKNVLESPDLTVVGIGSILTSERLEKFVGGDRKIAVLGTGVSYGTPPSDMSAWCLAAVRGPLSAAVLGQPNLSVTDGAILLALTQNLYTKQDKPEKIIFMPHRSSLQRGSWEPIATELGMEYVSPQTDTLEILRKFGEAKLVITEAMHGAIVADTMRIPWIPVTIHPHIDEFKWKDWTYSMGLDYRPISLPSISADDFIYYQGLRGNMKKFGIHGTDTIRPGQDRQMYLDYLSRRFSPSYEQLHHLTKSIQHTRKAVSKFARITKPLCKANARRALGQAMKSPQYLSGQALFNEKLLRMQEAIRTVEKFVS
ncbi:hypothetical protein CPT32_01955 [Rhizobium sophoriradicis]|uniref:polysaccharide pyruvyl transferase family protein n=1 Tax=Rhizobium sophoriradicis TaxID=1535245 RepID=UPI000BBDCDE9|nr:polysaccharide pyruvyl transferase family protein [Rhizobium sophoriradicis]PCK88386.1 hypothetical protein CPT32_01955 [Rhizobium sophoriradicis]